MLDVHVVGRFDFQQAVADGKILNVDLEVDQYLEERGGRTLSAIDDAPAPVMPATRRAQRSVTCKGEVVADPRENHLRCHALIDSVQQLVDEPGSCFSCIESQRTATRESPRTV